jgi:guanylate kinase
MKKASLFVVSGPSAVGKNSVVSEILKMDGSLTRAVTCTTRKMRKSEKHGEDYFFMKKKDFLSAVERKDFIEFSEIYKNYYGIMFSHINEKIAEGKDVILIINFDGFQKIKQNVSKDIKICGIFILPPSVEDLELRIRSRGEDSTAEIAHRLSVALKDMEKAKFYDFCFKNSDITTTARAILETINGVRQRRSVT